MACFIIRKITTTAQNGGLEFLNTQGFFVSYFETHILAHQHLYSGFLFLLLLLIHLWYEVDFWKFYSLNVQIKNNRRVFSTPRSVVLAVDNQLSGTKLHLWKKLNPAHHYCLNFGWTSDNILFDFHSQGAAILGQQLPCMGAYGVFSMPCGLYQLKYLKKIKCWFVTYIKIF